MTYKEKLQSIRQQMAEQGINAYIITGGDPHLSEYLPEHYKIIPFVSGFSGSAGVLVITQQFAGLWTDSRYFTQAEAELQNSGFELVKLVVPHMSEYTQWLCQTLNAGNTVAFDHQLLSFSLALEIKNKLSEVEIKSIHADLISAFWQNRPALPQAKAFLIDDAAAGLTAAEKINAVRAIMKKSGAQYHLISTLDDVAWLLNLRGSDVAYNPVCLSYLLIGADTAQLFIYEGKLSAAELQKLNQQGISTQSYSTLNQALSQLPANASILLDPKRTAYHIFNTIPKTVNKELALNPSTHLKSIKNESEIKHIRQAMLADGIALTRFFKWLEENYPSGALTEISAAEKLLSFRAAETTFAGPSFNTIAGYNANGALPHYHATAASNTTISGNGLFLVDSGGQYHYGTTDVTRVLPIGQPTAQQIFDYTLVLKGLIEGSKLIFPEGTKGNQIDAVCRQPLWAQQINYGHGTGHGIGFYLNVHEGPQNISPAMVDVAFKPGMVTSIEPGIYRPGAHGVRIENLVLCTAVGSNSFGNFLQFETLTLAPIETSLINKNDLEQTQIDWLNRYNNEVYNKLSPYLNADEVLWLQEKCKAI